MSNLFDDSISNLLNLDDYRADLWKKRAGQESWKLERQQYFSDPTDAPWVAFAEGRWEDSLLLMEDNRPLFDNYCRKATESNTTLYRVRIVEWPIQPYVQWEFHYLRLATNAGEKIRVVNQQRVKQFENDGPLPDILTAGTDTVYRVLYTREGVPDAARRIVDAGVAERCIDLIKELYADGEDMDEFFEREIAHLGPAKLC